MPERQHMYTPRPTQNYAGHCILNCMQIQVCLIVVVYRKNHSFSLVAGKRILKKIVVLTSQPQEWKGKKRDFLREPEKLP